MKIILIRHGIAEDHGKDDFHRDLTPEGRIKLNRSFQLLAERLPLTENYTVYSSPLIRAVETTKILCRNIHRNYEVMDFLAGCTTVELLQQLEENNNYILVGHEPFLGRYIYDLTGKFMPVSRGSIHGIKVENGTGRYLCL